MLTRRAKAYSSSCSQTVSLSPAILPQFILVSALQPKIAKINKKTLSWKFRVFQSHLCWYDWKARSLVLVVIGSMPMPICNSFHERLANNGKITTLTWYTALWCPCVQVFLNLENRDLDRRNLRSVLKISYAACPCLSQLLASAQVAF